MIGKLHRLGLLFCVGMTMVAVTACSAPAERTEQVSESLEAEETEDSEEEDGFVITWNGKTYRYNDHKTNFLFLGVDTEEKEATSKGQADAGQTDALFVLSLDRVTDELTVITIPRDTMTEIQFYGPDGSDLGKDIDHISLAYAYGDGDYESCKLSAEAVSNLLYQVPIQYYCAMSLGGIGKLTEAVGGLTVTVPNDSLASQMLKWTEGTEAELTPENTELFVRYRDIETSQSALDRTERQKAFLQAFYKKLKELSETDNGIWVKLYETMKPYLITNMGNDLFLKLEEAVHGNEEIRQWTVPGNGQQGENFDEYIIDDGKLYEQIIETFYEET